MDIERAGVLLDVLRIAVRAHDQGDQDNGDSIVDTAGKFADFVEGRL